MAKRKRKDAVGILTCKVSRSVFTNEFFVIIELPSGEVLTTLADKSQIVPPPTSEELEAKNSVNAGVRVSILDRIRDKLLVDLPRETFSSGSRVLVPASMIQSTLAG